VRSGFIRKAERERLELEAEARIAALQQSILSKVVLGDSTSKMDSAPDNIVLLLTDPPYGKEFQSNRRVGTAKADVLAEYLGMSTHSSHSYVADILARQREEKKMTAFRLGLLGWTQEEIGEVIGLSHRQAGNILEEFSDLKNFQKNLLDQGHPHLTVAERQKMPLQLVWAIDLEGRTDKERMNRLGINIQPYDVWNFATSHDLFGSQHPGRIPGRKILQIF